MSEKIQLNTIEEAIEAIKNGEVIIVVDDENRENEGDFICAAEKVTPEIINFMATHGRGLICASLVEDRCEELGLDLMVRNNSAAYETPFTVSVDLIGHGCTTGISASDRAKTVQALVDPNTRPEELGKPGHIFPLKAKRGGVLRRTGHTEATIDFARLAGLKPGGVLVEIMNEDGTMARLPDLKKVADKFNLKLVSIEDLIEYRLANESLIEKDMSIDLPTEYGDFHLQAYKQINTGEVHLAVIKGEWDENEPVLVRVHSSSTLGDIFGFKHDAGNPIKHALRMIEKEGKGVVLYMNQNARGQRLLHEMKILQQEGITEQPLSRKFGVKMDEKDYGVGAQILRDLNIHKLKLISNNPQKRVGLIGYGLEITEYVPLETE
ncbi:3,4-dihydroxy-2-butanone-4-phosphate synthase [Roseivirga pacifica]|uniref:3,4-dihydroxy-2-butanone-4-phosphate synthase n=1 Tax=Roseivirga pacifica TaxID=1267423 RepID=UPI0020961AC4|nr:3,4-dihydroxy-2-butanone-4-phosphate synthase [Roseivirga pacifica]MCO6358525.1 3,4-dihydroxy-2-butanone-4-phosphate synthase [Roseivirga pacifica]MCO6369080.1 3,4-dihydroxy-2-butanone-4-phosphate synthase [Roseivirga pacifica]MCO6372216.1 3,4-dihydroxy-2-butanone-4-phosphate synthase [Roseivirga pacifica]MCO6374256.1 3,4-dihydroxy-2-butanone-4-phosphate synthase [Roseivirga pacifica]MCO6380947.1 3,4-dihydroxy-2-butanone-4-phosphate synthase [Roseivirga pacifica]